MNDNRVLSVAIVGVSCRLPGADGPEEFWRNLAAGVDSITEIPESRWSVARYYNPDVSVPNTSPSKWAGLISGHDRFDNQFFNISPREAKAMDPQQRLLLEESWRCVEDSGVGLEELRRGRCGVFVGAMAMDYYGNAMHPDVDVDAYTAASNYQGIQANRVSWFLGLRGESKTVDTACSSSLVALNDGCRALQSGDSEYALVGGVSLIHHPWKYISFGKSRMLSPDGRCKTFDRDANGYVPGEGCVVVLLEPLERALEHGHRVYGLIRGIHVNHVGRTSSLTAPSVEVQAELVAAAQAKAGVSAESISYIEAHGTGTSLGDPIEVEGLTRAFRRSTSRSGFCRIGSVKTNIGHLEAAAGLSGVLKVLLMFKHRQVPPHLHLKQANPLIDFPSTPFVPVTGLTAWESVEGQPRLAGVSSFGMGGANGHVVLEELPEAESAAESRGVGAQPMLLSAASREGLRDLVHAWKEGLSERGLSSYSPADVGRTLALGRSHFKHRLGLAAESLEELGAWLEELEPGAGSPGERGWVLELSSSRVTGLSELDFSVFSHCPGHGERYKSTLALVREVTGVSSPSRLLKRQTWPDKHVGVLGLATGYLYFSGLMEVSGAPSLIRCTSEGLLLGLCLSQAMELREGLELALSGALLEPDRTGSRSPASAVESHGRVLLPPRPSADYLGALLLTLSRDGAAVSSLWGGVHPRASSLISSQFTFRKFIQEWDGLHPGLGLLELLEGGASCGDEPGLGLCVRALAVMDSLCRLYAKWDLEFPMPGADPRLQDLHQLLSQGLLGRDELVEVCLSPEPEAVLEQLSGRVASRIRSLDGLVLAPDFLEPVRWREARESLEQGAVLLGFGPEASPEAASSLQAGARLRDGLVRDLVHLWCGGVDCSWPLAAGALTGRTVSLPSTRFQRKRFWLEPPRREAGEPRSPVPQPESGPALEQVLVTRSWTRSSLESLPPEGRKFGALLVVVENQVELAAARDLASWLALPLVSVRIAGPGISPELLVEQVLSQGTGEELDRVLQQVSEVGGDLGVLFLDLSDLNREVVDEGSLLVKLGLYQRVLKRWRRVGLRMHHVGALLPGSTSLHPGGSLSSSLHKLAPFEYNSVASAAIGLDPAECRGALGQVLLSLVSRELPASEVHYREGQLWVPAAVVAPCSEPGAPLSLDGSKTYLITGGTRGIGAMVARRFAQRGARKLVLLGNSPAPAREDWSRIAEGAQEGPRDKARLYLELVSQGVELEVVAGDVADPEVLVSLVRTHPDLGGVVHCAGLMDQGSPAFINKDPSEISRVLAPKVKGVANLALALEGAGPDFVVLFSSISSFVPRLAAGLSIYSMANAYLNAYGAAWDTLVEYPVKSICWPSWSDSGMGAAASGPYYDLGFTMLSATQGLDLLERCLGLAGADPVLPAWVDGSRFRPEVLFQPGAGLSGPESLTPAAGEPGVAEATEVDQEELESWVLGLLSSALETEADSIDPNEPFFELGVDSVLIQELMLKLGGHFGGLSPTVLFEQPTVRKLAAHLRESHAGEAGALFPVGLNRGTEQVSAVAPGPGSAAVEAVDREDIAVIGMAGRFPGAEDLNEFWDNLVAGLDCVTEVPRERWDAEGLYDPDPEKISEGRIYGKWGGFLKDVDCFDPLFFRISPKEAEVMDPQERLLLQETWHALEDAGYSPQGLRRLIDGEGRADVGVFAACTVFSYMLHGPEQWERGNYVIPRTFPWSIANRISYTFDFRGPSMPVDTACSSGLSAVHVACESLKSGACSVAIAGAVNLFLHPQGHAWRSQMTMLSPTGRCHTFGAQADGFVPGEGVAALVLKPLSLARRDGDRIHGVIRATAINHDGKTTGYTVPNPAAQASLIRGALDRAGLSARSLSYIEAHGTGTRLGDPIEVTGLTQAFRQDTEDRGFCHLGSVKSNIGHLEAAAGVAGIIKILLQMKHGRLVPSLHTQELNPRIDFEATPFRVVRDLTPWQPTGPRRAGVSAFGAGGVNAHVIIEESPAGPQEPSGEKQVVLLSARDGARLGEVVERLASQLARWESEGTTPSLAAIASTLRHGRQPLEERLAVVAESVAELRQKLQTWTQPGPGVFTGRARAKGRQTPVEWAGSFAGEAEQLAFSWCNGAEVSWSGFGTRTSPISLPTYPFERQRCWIPILQGPGARQNGGVIHPLVAGNDSTLFGQRYLVDLPESEVLLRSHVVNHTIVLPGAAQLEMARAAAEHAGEARVLRLERISWLRPAVPDHGRLQLRIELEDGEAGLDFKVFGKELCSQGRVSVVWDGVEGLERKQFDGIAGRCDRVLGQEEIYSRFTRMGLEYGEEYRTIEELRYGKGEAIGLVRLPAGCAQDAGKYVLHPSVLDGAFQSMLGVMVSSGMAGATTYLPYALESLTIHSSLNQDCWCVVRPRGMPAPGASALVFDLDVFSIDYSLLATIRGFTLKSANRSVPRSNDPLMELMRALENGELELNQALKQAEELL